MVNIKIRCEGKIDLSLDDLHILQDGDNFELKKLSKNDLEALVNSIVENGFLFPFFVWYCDPEKKWYFLDGTQRDKALLWMRKQPQKYKLPDKFPCAIIHADNKEEAAKAILLQSSRYGEITLKGYEGFDEAYKIQTEKLLNTVKLRDLNLERYVEKKLKVESNNPELKIPPELFERHDYLVFYFDNDFDFQVACEFFDVKKVKTAQVKGKTIEQVGLSRVLQGSELAKVIQDDQSE